MVSFVASDIIGTSIQIKVKSVKGSLPYYRLYFIRNVVPFNGLNQRTCLQIFCRQHFSQYAFLAVQTSLP